MLVVRSKSLKRFAFAGLLVASSLQLGCDRSEKRIPLMEPNVLYLHALEISEDYNLKQASVDTEQLLTEWFGTLDEPKLPPLFEKDYPDLLSLEKLKIAAGPPSAGAEPGATGIYRQLCASCHGETGQGRGPVAASQNPYPREFRHGLYKFKSSSRNDKPLKEDIKRLLIEGLADSQMPKFAQLSSEQLDALVDYVIFLSIRGELERKMYFAAAFDLDEPETSRLVNLSLRDATSEEDKATYEEQITWMEDLLMEVADKWVEAADGVEEFDEPDFPLFGQETDENREELEASIAKGRELYIGQIAACSKCHGETGLGDGPQAPDYDDWTKDWTTKIGISPTDLETLLPLMARGGLKPQALKARNLVSGAFRGGSEPLDIYRRIRYGIPGATMPAAAIARGGNDGLTNDDIWHLVNYVLSIAEKPEQTEGESAPATPSASAEAAATTTTETVAP